MRNLILQALFLLSSISLKAQSAREIMEGYKDVFLENKIYVVYTGSPKMDSALKECFGKFWTLRPIQGYVTKDEFKQLIKDKSNSFFYTTRYSYSVGNNNSRVTSCIFAFNGGRKNTGKYLLVSESASKAYFDTYLAEEDMENAIYRLPLMVARLQWDINLKYDMAAAPKFDPDKILLINEKLLEGNKGGSIDKGALASWPWKYEIKSPEEIGNLVRARDNHYLLLTPFLSEPVAAIYLYDLASMRIITQLGKSAFKKVWVRDKEIQNLVDQVRNIK